MDKLKDWDKFEIGSVLFPFKKGVDGRKELYKYERTYSGDSSFTDSVAHWRVEKPVHNREICINCFNCWVFCPDAAILTRDEKLAGVDYVHCKGCGVCVDVCPTNPKSLLMFSDHKANEEALKEWPAKESKKPQNNA